MSDRNGATGPWIVVLLLGVIIGVPLLTMGGGMMGGSGLGMLGGGMFLGPLLVLGPLLFLGLVILLLSGATNGSARTSIIESIETLRERYARGEISEEEFEKRVRTLREQ